MKTILVTAAMILSTNLYADPFDIRGDNPDLYDGDSTSTVVATAVQPGVGDNYASSFLFSTGFVASEQAVRFGTDDAYGSVILDLGHPIDW
ncbi:MAG: hypothetical protein P8166_08315 [Candidatus Thiodiazotropha sp.]|jgi:hypothetical protein